jgi:hypothetical protein
MSEQQTRGLANGLRSHGMPPDSDEADKSKGGATKSPAKPRARRPVLVEKGRGRNIKIPDGLYDPLSQLARRTKVKTTWERSVNGVKVSVEQGYRYQTISEAVCEAIVDYLKKKNVPVTDTQEDAA